MKIDTIIYMMEIGKNINKLGLYRIVEFYEGDDSFELTNTPNILPI